MGRLRQTVLSLAVVCGTFAVLELLARWAYPIITPGHGRLVVSVLLGETTPTEATGYYALGEPISEIEIRPYYLYINKPGSKLYGMVQHTAEGYRGEPVSPAPGPGVLRILAIGGSTTYGWMLKDYRQAWPYQLQELLKARLHRPVEVVNAGLPNALSAEEMVGYFLRDRFLRAQIVIIHTGGNDAGPLLYPDYRPDYSNFRSIQSGEAVARPGERVLLKSYLARIFYGWWLERANLSIFRGSPAAPDTASAMESAQRNEPVGFERNLSLLVRTVLDDGATPILFPFVVAPKQVYSVLPPKMSLSSPLYDPFVVALGKDVQVIHKVAAEYRVPMVELPAERVPLRDFLDISHLNPDGERIKATLLAGQIEKLVRAGKGFSMPKPHKRSRE